MIMIWLILLIIGCFVTIIVNMIMIMVDTVDCFDTILLVG